MAEVHAGQHRAAASAGWRATISSSASRVTAGALEPADDQAAHAAGVGQLEQGGEVAGEATGSDSKSSSRNSSAPSRDGMYAVPWSRLSVQRLPPTIRPEACPGRSGHQPSLATGVRVLVGEPQVVGPGRRGFDAIGASSVTAARNQSPVGSKWSRMPQLDQCGPEYVTRPARARIAFCSAVMSE